MGKGYKLARDSVLDRLQRPRGYQQCRIRPCFTAWPRTWFAEVFTPDRLRKRKSWKTLADEDGTVRAFLSPEVAQQALIDHRGQPFKEPTFPYYILLARARPEEDHWWSLVHQHEQHTPGSLETMIEDASARLVAAMRELRETSEPKRFEELREIVEGQSNRLRHLSLLVYQETLKLQWLRVSPASNP